MILRTCLIFALCLAATACRAEQPNVILIIADDLGWGDISVHGGPIDTPAIDGLFIDGIELTNLHAATVCHPSRFRLFTGIDPGPGGNPGQWAPLEERVFPPIDNIAHAYRDAGYTTALFGKWDNSATDPTTCGFELFVPSVMDGHTIGGMYETYVIPELVAVLPEPYFAVCAFTVPHNPPISPPEFRAGDSDQAHYDGMVRALDDAVGNLPRDGITFFLSDNGAHEEFGRSHPLYRGAKHKIELGGVIVPAALHGLGPGTIDKMVSERDVWTTLASLCEGVRGGGHSVNFLSGVRSQEFYCSRGVTAWRGGADNRWHYIRYRNGRERLYDVIRDPLELNDLAKVKPQVLINSRKKHDVQLSQSYWPD